MHVRRRRAGPVASVHGPLSLARHICCRVRLELHGASVYARYFATAPRPASWLRAYSAGMGGRLDPVGNGARGHGKYPFLGQRACGPDALQAGCGGGRKVGNVAARDCAAARSHRILWTGPATGRRRLRCGAGGHRGACVRALCPRVRASRALSAERRRWLQYWRSPRR